MVRNVFVEIKLPVPVRTLSPAEAASMLQVPGFTVDQRNPVYMPQQSANRALHTYWMTGGQLAVGAEAALRAHPIVTGVWANRTIPPYGQLYDPAGRDYLVGV